MITIAILHSSPRDELQLVASKKLKTMITSNISLLLSQLNSGTDIKNVLHLSIIENPALAAGNDMVFLLSDIFDAKNTQSIFDKLPNKSKILIDLHPESKNDWKCATNSSKSIQSCFEGQKEMSTKELLLRILDKHNKKKKHGSTKAILLSALALGLECYDEKSDSAFCKNLMKDNHKILIHKAFNYDMNKRGVKTAIRIQPKGYWDTAKEVIKGVATGVRRLAVVSAPLSGADFVTATVIPAMSWMGTLITTSFSALKSAIFVGLAYTTLAPALAIIAGISIVSLIVVLLAVKKYKGSNNLFAPYATMFTTSIKNSIGSMCSNVASFFRWLIGDNSPSIKDQTAASAEKNCAVTINVTKDEEVVSSALINNLMETVAVSNHQSNLKWILLTIAVKMPAIMIQLARMTYEVGIRSTFTMEGFKCAMFVVDAMIYHNITMASGLMVKTEYIFQSRIRDHIPNKFNSISDYGLETLEAKNYPMPSTFQCVVYGISVLAFALGASGAVRTIAGGSSNPIIANLEFFGIGMDPRNPINGHNKYVVITAAGTMLFVSIASIIAEFMKGASSFKTGKLVDGYTDDMLACT